MQKNYFFLAVSLLILPGCSNKQKKIAAPQPTTPVVPIENQTNLQYSFDEEIAEFAQVIADLEKDIMADNTNLVENDSSTISVSAIDNAVWDEDCIFNTNESELDEFKTVLFEQGDTILLSEAQEKIMNENIAYAKKLIEENNTVQFYLTGDASAEELFSGEGSTAENRTKFIMEKLIAAGIPQELITMAACNPEDGMLRKDEVSIGYTIS